ncbi:hypothetical protein AQUCO_00100727v1 [Aquilegia coerulea]|uniref:Protein FAR1-RELATED SEQUENCE n=1 Tax=Aquilegia coerulea TaxID=218851 RepID=A0A2G5FBW9_AQUCA|nr:hypothetical protein AQUCO_00100727v1 [Aquilegia coerulea]
MSEDEYEDCEFADSINIDENNKLNVDQDIEPKTGMTFPTYEDAKNFYNRHAMRKGFGTRVKRSCIDRKTKEKNFVWLSCSKEGFKIEKEGVVHKRPNPRVGCDAHLKVKMDSNKWKIISFESEHNHVCSPSKSHRFRSHKHMESGSKKRLELHCDAGIRVNKSFHSMVVDAGGHANVLFGQKDARNYVNKYKRLKLQEGDAEAMHKYFTRMQQKNPNFFYLVDLDPEGRLRNVFWADARSRDAYKYFGDVVTFDTTYLTNRYDLKFASFVGVNHHGQSILFGCGLLADETSETFEWLFNAWLEAMFKHSLRAIITDQSKAMENAIIKVFPAARHQYKAIKKAMKNAVYESLRINEFEEVWASMVEKHKLQQNKWLTKLYNLRQKWVHVFLKDIIFAGMSITQPRESMNAFFDGYIHAKTSLKEFVDQYEMALEDKYEKESQADFDSFNASPPLKTSCLFESQLVKVYTKAMFLKFQSELYGMASCSKSQLRVDRKITTYAVKERVLDKNGNLLPPKTYEVYFNNGEIEVSCICRLFQHKEILCKHALHVLNEFVDEIPSQYILPRWRKDFKRTYNDNCCSHAHNPVQRYDVLYPCALQILEEGMLSDSKFKIVLDGFMELKKKEKPWIIGESQ